MSDKKDTLCGFSPIPRRGLMLVLSSPSGAGKTSICRRLLGVETGMVMSISVTTRPQRPAEKEGVDYYFTDTATFAALQKDEAFLEQAEVFGHHYGTRKKPVFDALGAGHDVLFDVDWQGAQQLAHNAPRDVVTVFILPPSMQELKRRLHDRGQDDADVLSRRMDGACGEIERYPSYDYVLINHDVDHSVACVRAILAAERLRQKRQTGLGAFVTTLRQEQV